MVRLEFDAAGLEAELDALAGAIKSGVRVAAQAGAQVFYDEVKLNVGKLGHVTGNLNSAIYQKYSPEASREGEFAQYHISWNYRKAPHGHLIEFGHIQRYVAYLGKDGKFHTAIRPSMRGKKKPPRKASQAVKDAYYVPLPAPVQVPAKPFIRPAFEARKSDALDAAWEAMKRHIEEKTR